MISTQASKAAVFSLLCLAIAAACHAADSAPPPPAKISAKRPNIVFCFADDWGRYAGIYATIDDRPSINQVLKTPRIDQVAREGVLFRNAFVTAPSCTPCRSSLLSGQYFFRTGGGAILVGAQWDSTVPTYPLMLRDAGYHIGKSYKVWSPGTPADAPYGGQKYAYEKAGRDFNMHYDRRVLERVKNGMSLDAAKVESLEQVRKNFDAFLADRNPGQPFCYWFGPTLTHRPYTSGSGKELWGLDPESVRGKLPKFMPDVPEVRDDFLDYMGQVMALDSAVGAIVDRLREAGELDNTILVLSGDHGMPGVPGGKCNLYDFGVAVPLIVRGPGIKAGRVVDDFVNLMDLAPTFLDAAGLTPPTAMTGRSFMDVLHSDKAGQVDPQRDWVVTGRERHHHLAQPGALPYPQRALRTKNFLYVRNFAPDRWPMGDPKFTGPSDMPTFDALAKTTEVVFADMDASPTKAWLVREWGVDTWKWHYDYAFGKRPAEELYDLRKDPDQTDNRADDPAYAKERKELSERLMQILKDAQDPRVTENPVPFESPPFYGRPVEANTKPVEATPPEMKPAEKTPGAGIQ